MRKKGQVQVLALVITLLAISTISMAAPEDEPELEQGGWERPGIDEAQMKIKNKTGFFRFDLDATGWAPEGTDRVEVTFGGLNGTKIELSEEFWFKEGTQFLFIYGSTLKKEEGPHEWSNWSFNIWISLPSDGGIEGAMGQIGSMFGLDTGNISMGDLDLANLTVALSNTSFYIVARAYNETGAWGQEAFDLTDHFYTAILQFMIDEGLLDDPSVDDDDDDDLEPDEEKNNKDGLSPALMVGIFIAGMVALLAVVSVIIYLAITSKKKSQ